MEDPDATVQEGDTADIAYVGKIDGKEFDGGSSDSYNLVIGSGTFIDGFEDGVGHENRRDKRSEPEIPG